MKYYTNIENVYEKLSELGNIRLFGEVIDCNINILL